MTELASAPGERASDSNGAAITPINHWIDGSPVPGTSGRTAKVFNPATGRQSGAVDLASVEEVDRAVQSAKAAFASWRGVSLAKRAELMFTSASSSTPARRTLRGSWWPSTARCSPTRWAR